MHPRGEMENKEENKQINNVTSGYLECFSAMEKLKQNNMKDSGRVQGA